MLVIWDWLRYLWASNTVLMKYSYSVYCLSMEMVVLGDFHAYHNESLGSRWTNNPAYDLFIIFSAHSFSQRMIQFWGIPDMESHKPFFLDLYDDTSKWLQNEVRCSTCDIRPLPCQVCNTYCTYWISQNLQYSRPFHYILREIAIIKNLNWIYIAITQIQNFNVIKVTCICTKFCLTVIVANDTQVLTRRQVILHFYARV